VLNERLPRIESKLKGRADEGALFLREVIAGVKREFLFEGFAEFFRQLLPRQGKIVLGHCDT